MSKHWTLAEEHSLIYPAFRKLKLDKFQGSWSLEFHGLTIIIIITPVKVVVNGKTIMIKRNKNKKYPFSKGWISFQFEGWTYYFKRNENLTVRANRKGEMVRGKVGKWLKIRIRKWFHSRHWELFFWYRDKSFYFSIPVKTDINHDDKNVKNKLKSTTNDTNKTSIIQLEKNIFANPKQENIVPSKSNTAVRSDSGAELNSTFTPQNEAKGVAKKNESKLFQYDIRGR